MPRRSTARLATNKLFAVTRLVFSKFHINMKAAATYNDYWQSGLHIPGEWPPELFQKLFEPMKGRAKVLDYGCGLGCGYQRCLIQNVEQYIGADISEFALQQVQKKGVETLQISEQGTVAVPDGTFDGAVCSEVFEHLWDPLASAKELHRVMKPGGVLIASVPNFGYFSWRLLALLRAQVPLEADANRYRGVHIRFFSLLMFQRLFQDAGFKEVKITSWQNGSVWHIFRCAGPLGKISDWADKKIPAPFHLRFLGELWPNLFAERIRAVAIK